MPAIPSPGDTTTPQAALERLDAALDPHDFATTLIATPGQPPRLAVTSRHAALGDDIYADHHSYWWSWNQPIAALGNPAAAATKISTVLAAHG